jgi:hypothetical protein
MLLMYRLLPAALQNYQMIPITNKNGVLLCVKVYCLLIVTARFASVIM